MYNKEKYFSLRHKYVKTPAQAKSQRGEAKMAQADHSPVWTSFDQINNRKQAR